MRLAPALMIPVTSVIILQACASSFAQTCDPNAAVNVKSCYGAKGDVLIAAGCSMTSGSATLTCTGASFASTDISKTVYVQGAGPSGASLSSTISAFASATQVTLATSAATSVRGNRALWATDDTTALQNAYNYAAAHGYALYIPGSGGYLHHGLNWTGNSIKIYGDAYPGTNLYAIAVTNPGKINGGAQTVGVDISGSGYNQISNIAFWGSLPQWFDLAPAVNILAGRSGSSGNPFAIAHVFETNFFVTNGQYNVVLLGYEQSDFSNSHFETNTVTTGGNLFLSAVNTPAFISPYVSLVTSQVYASGITATGTTGQTCQLTSFSNSSTETATVALTGANTIASNTPLIVTSPGLGATTLSSSARATNGTAKCSGTAVIVNVTDSMTKVNVSGGRSVFSGNGRMIVLDQGASESNYSVSIRDAFADLGPGSVFLSDLGTGALRHVVLDTVYAETNSNQNSAMVSVSGPAWNWRLDNAQIYNSGGLTVSPYRFANGFLDGEALIDSQGQAAGYNNPEFYSSSCAGSVLHLGQEQPTTNCTNYALLNSVSGSTLGITANGSGLVTGSIANTNLSIENSSVGHATCWKTTGTIGYCSSAISSTGTCTCN